MYKVNSRQSAVSSRQSAVREEEKSWQLAVGKKENKKKKK
jgi:hypothetical protein